jgi:hypothetical protein
MSPRFWHSVAVKFEPHTTRLARVSIGSGITTGALFLLLAAGGFRGTFSFICLWYSAVSLAWCAGLLLLVKVYAAPLTMKAPATDEPFLKCFATIVGRIMGIYLFVWFLLLLAATLLFPALFIIATV